MVSYFNVNSKVLKYSVSVTFLLFVIYIGFLYRSSTDVKVNTVAHENALEIPEKIDL